MNKFSAILFVVLFLGCGTTKKAAEQKVTTNSSMSVNESINKFGFHLYRQITNTNENSFFSPISISSAMAMAYLGADGNTEKEFRETLFFAPNNPEFHKSFKNHSEALTAGDGMNQLSIANSIWVQQNFKLKQGYVDGLNSYYSGNFFAVDFMNDQNRNKAQQKINNWVEKETNSKIKNIIPNGVLTPQTKTVLVNAVYFLSQWNKPFDERRNTEKPFYLNGEGEMATATFMNNSQTMPYFEDGKIQAVEIPYKENKYSLMVVLTKDKNPGDWYKKTFTDEYFNNVQNGFQSQLVDLSLPKFKMETTYDLIPSFQALGMQESFSNSANFSKMRDENDLKITDILHKAFVEVNEKGTEAAASTAVIMSLKSAAITPEKKKFIADHPFLFMILEKETNTVLFMGELNNPK